MQTDLQEFFLITSSILDIWPSRNHRLSHPASPASVHILSLFLGPRGPLVLPLVNPRTRPPVRNEKLDPMYTGIYAS